MNILLVTGPGVSLKEPYDSGIEAFIVSLANELIVEGHTVDVVAQEAEIGAKFKLINPFDGLRQTQPGFLKRIKETRQFSTLDVSSYDVIHFNMFYPHLLKAGLAFDKPSLLTLHSPADKKRVSVYRRLSSRGNLTFVAISDRIKRQWEEALNRNIPLVNNGIPLKHWPAKLQRDGEYLLWSARINEVKNVAAAISLAKHLQLPLKIAGRIVDQPYFDNEVGPHLSSQIQYVGHVTQRELSNLAGRAIVYLATATWQEPFGLSALEMLASGVPVVGFHTAVPPDWNHPSILTTMSPRWQDLEKLVQKSRAIPADVCQNFASELSVQKMTANYLELYRKVQMKGSIDAGALLENVPDQQAASRESRTSK